MRIRTQCRSCGLPFRETLTRETTTLLCPGCGEPRPVSTTAWSRDDPRHVERCLICDCKHLYRQRDFNRALGCLLVAIGAVFVPWTYGLSLVVLAGVDLWYYRQLKEKVVCYRCDTVYRDADPSPRQGEFDLLKHDVLKYGKSWQDVDLTESG